MKGDEITTPKPEPFTRLFYDVIKSKGKDVMHRCILQSFDPRTLQVMHRLDTTVRTALLIENLHSLRKNLDILGFTPTIYSPNDMLVNKKLVDECHELGMKILPWTVNEEKRMKSLKEMGVDGMISDYPDRLIKVIRGN